MAKLATQVTSCDTAAPPLPRLRPAEMRHILAQSPDLMSAATFSLAPGKEKGAGLSTAPGGFALSQQNKPPK